MNRAERRRRARERARERNPYDWTTPSLGVGMNRVQRRAARKAARRRNGV